MHCCCVCAPPTSWHTNACIKGTLRIEARFPLSCVSKHIILRIASVQQSTHCTLTPWEVCPKEHQQYVLQITPNVSKTLSRKSELKN